MQTPTGSAAKAIFAPPPTPLRLVEGHNSALVDPVCSEMMFEKCGRRQRRACLYDKFTNQYIKHSARIIRSKICRIKMTYTFEDAVPKEDNQIECDFTRVFLCSRPVTQTGQTVFLRKLTEQTFIFIDSILKLFRGHIHRSRLCRGPNSEKVKQALPLEPYGIVWWNFTCPLMLTKPSPRDCKISLSTGRGFAEVQIVKTWTLSVTLEP